jgi:hypothetical protein
MKIESRTEIEKKRATWWTEHFKTDMPVAEVLKLNEQCASLFPATPDERRLKTESLLSMPEFKF